MTIFCEIDCRMFQNMSKNFTLSEELFKNPLKFIFILGDIGYCVRASWRNIVLVQVQSLLQDCLVSKFRQESNPATLWRNKNRSSLSEPFGLGRAGRAASDRWIRAVYPIELRSDVIAFECIMRLLKLSRLFQFLSDSFQARCWQRLFSIYIIITHQ